LSMSFNVDAGAMTFGPSEDDPEREKGDVGA
jgi:hypothetical protein